MPAAFGLGQMRREALAAAAIPPPAQTPGADRPLYVPKPQCQPRWLGETIQTQWRWTSLVYVESRAGRERCCQHRGPALPTLGHETAVFYRASGPNCCSLELPQARGWAKPRGRCSGVDSGFAAPALHRYRAAEMNYFLFLSFLAASGVHGGCSVLPHRPCLDKGPRPQGGVFTPFHLHWGSSFPLASPQQGEQL